MNTPSVQGQTRWSGGAGLLLVTVLVILISIMSGSASALFLWSLDRVTALRFENAWLLYLLPIIGPGIVWAYARWGGDSQRGTNLLLEEVHTPDRGVPARMAPFVLAATLVTHLFGGSAGREGTAVQMGGGIAGGCLDWCKVPRRWWAILLMSGMASGFGAVFGTPWAGAVFAIEVLAVGKMDFRRLLPCVVAAWVGDLTCSAWGIHHTAYTVAPLKPAVEQSWWLFYSGLVGKIVLLGVACGAVARLFVLTMRWLGKAYEATSASALLRPVIGGGAVVVGTLMLGDPSYLGLGVTSPSSSDVTIVSSFHTGGAAPSSWLLKLLFTAVTLSSGFKGGEVTPLFFVGASLGNAVAVALQAPVDLFAALGFVAVFAGASNTPVACAIMGMELFGPSYGIWLLMATGLSFLLSGHSGIYAAQKIARPKLLH